MQIKGRIFTRRILHIKTAALLVAISSLTVLGGCDPNAGEVKAERIIGSWACESGSCPDEEISFSIDDGVRTYNSWLHARPAAAGGTWQLNGNVLSIDCCAGIHEEWLVVSVTDRQLKLRDTNSSDEAVLNRI